MVIYNEEKNLFLKQTRGIGFEEILKAIGEGGLLDDIKHPSKRYSHQRMLVVMVDSYVFAVPYVLDKHSNIFLKTLFPSRSLTKKYLE